jgi:Ca-activated chloride channel family protein
MRLTFVLIAVCGAAAAAATAPRLGRGAAPPMTQQVFTAGTDLVHLPVSVTGRRGDPVRGLTADDFEVREDGRPQTIRFFAEGAPGDVLPLHVGLLLDTSESMQQDLQDAATAAVQFVDALEEPLDVTLVDFDSSVRLARFSPPSYPMLFERIRARKAGGMTALYDAIGVYLESAAARDGQHVLVMFTDGGDSTSSLNLGKLSEWLRRSPSVQVYAIGYLEHQTTSERTAQQMRLTQIAHETGGEAYFPSSAKQIRDIYAKILDELASRYTIGYTSSNPVNDGKFRKLQVKVTRADVKNVTIRTRPGYYAVR